MRTISCYDCGKPVSHSARACAQCGSKYPSGPAKLSRRAERRIGAEQRNDRNLIVMMVLLGAVGAFYGVETSQSLLGQIAVGAAYGFVGICIAVPLAFAVNVTRSWL